MKHPYLGQDILLWESENHKVFVSYKMFETTIVLNIYALRLHLNQLKTLLMCSVKNRNEI